MTSDLKHRSRYITDGRDQAPARAMYKAIGFTDADLAKPLIAVANTWIETMPCNFHLRRLSAKVKEGIRAAGGTPMEFNTIAISDGETMGTEGMKASLVSREVLAKVCSCSLRSNSTPCGFESAIWYAHMPNDPAPARATAAPSPCTVGMV